MNFWEMDIDQLRFFIMSRMGTSGALLPDLCEEAMMVYDQKLAQHIADQFKRSMITQTDKFEWREGDIEWVVPPTYRDEND